MITPPTSTATTEYPASFQSTARADPPPAIQHASASANDPDGHQTIAPDVNRSDARGFDPERIPLPLARFIFAPPPYRGVVAFLGKSIRIEEVGTTKAPMDLALRRQQLAGDLPEGAYIDFLIGTIPRGGVASEGLSLSLLSINLLWTMDENFCAQYAVEVGHHLALAWRDFSARMISVALSNGFGPSCPRLDGSSTHYIREFKLAVCPLRTAWEDQAQSARQQP